jgi:hypothetical protein
MKSAIRRVVAVSWGCLLLVLASALFTCCRDTRRGTAANATGLAQQAAPAATSAPSTGVPLGTRDPEIVELAHAALACKFEQGAFDFDCVEYRAWAQNEAIFVDGRGDNTVLSMLADRDERMRVLAIRRGFRHPEKYLAVKEHAAIVLAAAANETNERVSQSIAYLVVAIDADALDLGIELRALAKHPSLGFRRALARFVAKRKTPSAIDTFEILLNDREHDVQEYALIGLAGIDYDGTPPNSRLCNILSTQLDRKGSLYVAALYGAGCSFCMGMARRAIAEISNLVAEPSNVTAEMGLYFSLATRHSCEMSKADGLNEQAFAIGKKLVDPRILSETTRVAAMGVLVSCDPKRAHNVLRGLVDDKTQLVADSARRMLQELATKPKK